MWALKDDPAFSGQGMSGRSFYREWTACANPSGETCDQI